MLLAAVVHKVALSCGHSYVLFQGTGSCYQYCLTSKSESIFKQLPVDLVILPSDLGKQILSGGRLQYVRGVPIAHKLHVFA